MGPPPATPWPWIPMALMGPRTPPEAWARWGFVTPRPVGQPSTASFFSIGTPVPPTPERLFSPFLSQSPSLSQSAVEPAESSTAQPPSPSESAVEPIAKRSRYDHDHDDDDPAESHS
jgi:hypothetical protein